MAVSAICGTLNNMLCDILFVESEAIHNKLFAESTLTYEETLDIMRSLKIAALCLQDPRATMVNRRKEGNGVIKVHTRISTGLGTGKAKVTLVLQLWQTRMLSFCKLIQIQILPM